MIIVAGHIVTARGRREAVLAQTLAAASAAHDAAGSCEFWAAADPRNADRVVVFERWESEEALLAFRGDGPSSGIAEDIVAVNVIDYVVEPARP